MPIAIPKGVFDILPLDDDAKEPWRAVHLWQHLESSVREVAHLYNLREIRTPIFERTELFSRGVGSTSDIVSKEMYTFEDRAKRSMSLRPEGTASVVRAYLENRLEQQNQTHKLFYMGPMFRYERQQKGRYRQHHQFGVEIIGSEAAEYDAELIDLLWTLLSRLGLKDLTLHLNSLGDTTARLNFREALKTYLKPHLGELSDESQTRYELNPLRILDSKNMGDQEILKGAPNILDFLGEECLRHFEQVKKLLTTLGIPYTLNTRLVRGLDYYNRTVFEITSDQLGAQNSLGGGGRYDELFSMLEGPALPALGFGSGMERIIQTMIGQQIALPTRPHPHLLLVPLGDQARGTCVALAKELRGASINAEVDFSGKKLGKILGATDATHVAIIGEEELKGGSCEVKNMAERTTRQIPFEGLKDV